MKKMLFWALLLCPFCLLGQIVDSVALRQVDSLLKISSTNTYNGNFAKAFAVNASAEKIALEKFGPRSAAYGLCCNNRGRINSYSSNFPEAEKWHLEAKAIQQDALGKEHPDYATTLNSLAALYKIMGNYEKAEAFYLESKTIRQKVLGVQNPNYAGSLINLGNLYSIIGDFEKAEPLLLEAKEIFEIRLNDRKHSFYANCLHSLAGLNMQMGNYEKAEYLWLENQAIVERQVGKEHPRSVTSLINLAQLYSKMGDYEKAEPLYLEANTTWGKLMGKEHPSYALNLNNLATLYLQMGRYEKAELFMLEAMDIQEKVLGHQHPEFASSLMNLSGLYFTMGDYEKAEPPILEAKAIREKVFGKLHSDFTVSLSNLATLYAAMGNYKMAEPLYQEQTLLTWRMAEKAVRHLSERELGGYLNEFSKNLDLSLSFAHLSSGKNIVTDCFDNSLFYKGFLLQTAGQLKRLSLSDPASAEKFNLLKSYHRRLANQYARPIADRDNKTIDDMEAQVNDLEKDLARTAAGFGEATRQVKWQEVQAALRPDAAAVEFVSYIFYHKEQTDSMMYAALVLLPGAEQPQFIPLFEEKQLAALLQTEGKPQPGFYNDLYAADKKGSLLYELIWKPIAATLPESTTVYCSPSGLLHRVNLAAIPTPDGKTLADKNRLTILGSTRQLVVPTVPATLQTATAQLYGGILYDATPIVAVNTSSESNNMTTRGDSDFAQNDSTLRGENWKHLPWTDVEVTTAAEIMKGKDIAPTLKKGAEATEESFKAIGQNGPSPRVLHVATHGFFFPDPKGEKASNEKPFKVSDNPLIRSGLVLAGGNHAWKTGKPLRPDLEDGILTAYEISQMNLSNTELVVLSACETGLGDLVGNEGVYGLQRAFKIAGARYLIMSLWQVPDFQTQVFMTTFYKHWLEGKMDIPEAFRTTQSELQAQYPGEAFKWAGFVLVE